MLSKTWLTDKIIDAEYKRYLLLGYLQAVANSFEKQALYPALTELIEHFSTAKQLKMAAESSQKQFPKKLKAIDLNALKLNYDSLLQNAGMFDEVLQTVNYSLPKLKQYIDDGIALYGEIEDYINISPIGVHALNQKEGYLLMIEAGKKKAKAYEYQVTLFEKAEHNYRSLKTNFLRYYTVSLSQTIYTIKNKLVKTQTKYDNPAFYLIESEKPIPFLSCYFPVARRMLLKTIGQ